jgi:hypothetical protein
MAASAGVELLAIKDLPVPMSIAKSGALSVLEGMLQALARGELVVAPNPEMQANAVPVPDGDGPDGGEEQTPPGVGRIDGGKGKAG